MNLYRRFDGRQAVSEDFTIHQSRRFPHWNYDTIALSSVTAIVTRRSPRSR